MRAWWVVLCLAANAHADLAGPAATAGLALPELPATDGAWLAQLVSQDQHRIELTLLDLGTQKSHRRVFASTAAARRALAGFVPMRAYALLDRRGEELPAALRVDGQTISYDGESGRLTLHGRLLRSVALSLRDVCMGERRVSHPDDIRVWVAPAVLLVDYSTHGGSCMCDDRSAQRVVTAGNSFVVR